MKSEALLCCVLPRRSPELCWAGCVCPKSDAPVLPRRPPPAADDPKRVLPVLPNSPPEGFCPLVPKPPPPNIKPVLCWPPKRDVGCAVAVPPPKRLGALAGGPPKNDVDDWPSVKPVVAPCPNKLVPLFADWLKGLAASCCWPKRPGPLDDAKGCPPKAVPPACNTILFRDASM